MGDLINPLPNPSWWRGPERRVPPEPMRKHEAATILYRINSRRRPWRLEAAHYAGLVALALDGRHGYDGHWLGWSRELMQVLLADRSFYAYAKKCVRDPLLSPCKLTRSRKARIAKRASALSDRLLRSQQGISS